MQITESSLPGVFIIEPKVFGDHRGFFYESFNIKPFKEAVGYAPEFVQDNHSKSSRGVLRGLHFQNEPHAQAKLIRAIKGEILDVAVDIRKGSPNYGKHFSLILSEENKKQLFIPRGFAHGFVVLSETAEVLYKADNLYNPSSESSIVYNDPDIGIDWVLDDKDIILSDKDQMAKTLHIANNNFVFHP